MENRIRAAFDAIHADEKLVSRTKSALRRRACQYGPEAVRKKRGRLRLAGCLAVLALVILGTAAYCTPPAAIAIDINPSLELKVNAFDKVVSAKGVNEDGKAIVEGLSLKNLGYMEAVRRVLCSEDMEHHLNGENLLSITVVGGTLEEDDTFYRKIICSANAVAGEEKLYYCKADPQTMEAARKVGLNVARYRAMLELQKTDPGVSPEDVLGMSMRQVKELIGCQLPDMPCRCAGKAPCCAALQG